MVILFGVFFGYFRAAPVAYGSSQDRDQIGATAAGLHHSSRQCWILNPLGEVRDQTHILMDTCWVPYHSSTVGTPWYFYFLKNSYILDIHIKYPRIQWYHVCDLLQKKKKSRGGTVRSREGVQMKFCRPWEQPKPPPKPKKKKNPKQCWPCIDNW